MAILDKLSAQPSEDFRAFILSLPKAELHLHLEGAVSPRLLAQFAARHGAPRPARARDDSDGYGPFPDLAGFLGVYGAVCRLMRGPDDFEDATYETLRRSASGGAQHVELFFSPTAHDRDAIDYSGMLDGIIAGMSRARREFGVTTLLIPAHNRELGPESGMAFLDMVLADRREPVIGIGLDYGERGHPPAPFAAMFERARAEGLRVTAHAGEDGPAAHVRDSIEALGCRRIDHGYHVVDDPELMAMCRDLDVLFTVCPTTTRHTTVWRDLAASDHAIRRMIEAGLRVCVSSDDPAMFGTDLLSEYGLLMTEMGLDRQTITSLAANGLSHSWRR
jgi:adenosine deaminase